MPSRAADVIAKILRKQTPPWAHDYCRSQPTRLKFAAQVAMHSIPAAIEEARRCVRELGAVAIIGTPNPVNGRSDFIRPATPRSRTMPGGASSATHDHTIRQPVRGPRRSGRRGVGRHAGERPLAFRRASGDGVSEERGHREINGSEGLCYHTREVETFGAPLLDQDANRELFEEQVEIIFKSFNQRAFSHHGKYYTLPPQVPYRGYELQEITLVPRPKTLPVECWQPVVSASPRARAGRETELGGDPGLEVVNVGQPVGTPEAVILEQLERFSAQVMPAFK